jgi:hypothetical protein
MSDINRVLSLLGEAAKVAAVLPIPGAAAAAGAVRAAPAVAAGLQGIASAFDNFKAANGGKAPPAAQADRDAALRRVQQHAASTADRLEGRTR